MFKMINSVSRGKHGSHAPVRSASLSKNAGKPLLTSRPFSADERHGVASGIKLVQPTTSAPFPTCTPLTIRTRQAAAAEPEVAPIVQDCNGNEQKAARADSSRQQAARRMSDLRQCLFRLAEGHRVETEEKYWFLPEAVSMIAAPLSLPDPGFQLIEALPGKTEGMLAFDGKDVLVSQATVRACNDSEVFDCYLRCVVQWGLNHALFGEESARRGADQLGTIQRIVLDNRINQLYQLTTPPRLDKQGHQAARRVLEKEMVRTQATIEDHDMLWLPLNMTMAASRNEAAAGNITRMSGLPPRPASRHAAARSFNAVHEATLFWNAVANAMSDDAQMLFGRFNLGLVPPQSLQECHLRLKTFTRWLHDMSRNA